MSGGCARIKIIPAVCDCKAVSVFQNNLAAVECHLTEVFDNMPCVSVGAVTRKCSALDYANGIISVAQCSGVGFKRNNLTALVGT